MWNPFRSKLAAAILGGIDSIHMKPGSKVLYLGAAAGTTVSHVSDIVGPTGDTIHHNAAIKYNTPEHVIIYIIHSIYTIDTLSYARTSRPPTHKSVAADISVSHRLSSYLLSLSTGCVYVCS